MADDEKKTPAPPETPPEQTPPPTPKPDPDPPPGPVPYERFKDVNEKLKSTEARLAELEKAAKDQKDQELAEQNKWKELAEQRENELKQERLERLRLTVATSKGLPVELAARLQGEDQDALEADADKMLQFLKPSEGPGVPPPGRRQQSTTLNIEDMSPEEIRKNKRKILAQS